MPQNINQIILTKLKYLTIRIGYYRTHISSIILLIIRYFISFHQLLIRHFSPFIITSKTVYKVILKGRKFIHHEIRKHLKIQVFFYLLQSIHRLNAYKS